MSIPKWFWVYIKKWACLKNLSMLEPNFEEADRLGIRSIGEKICRFVFRKFVKTCRELNNRRRRGGGWRTRTHPIDCRWNWENGKVRAIYSYFPLADLTWVELKGNPKLFLVSKLQTSWLKQHLSKIHSFLKVLFQFMKTRSCSPNLSQLAPAGISRRTLFS